MMAQGQLTTSRGRKSPTASQAPRPSRRSPLVRSALRLARTIAIIYLGLLLVFSTLQANLIFPGRVTQGLPEARVTPPEGAELLRLTTPRGETITALFGRALAGGQPISPEEARAAVTILYFYGNGMCLADAVDQFQLFRELGCNVLIPDYPGFGMSSGEPSETGCSAAADASYAHLLSRKDVDPSRIVVAGWSLGGAVALDLAVRASPPPAGLIAFSTFTSLTELGQSRFPWIPVGVFLRHRFENDRKIARVACPILLGHGRQDEIVPVAMTGRLAKMASQPVESFVIDRASHNDFFETDLALLRTRIQQFLQSL